MMAKTDALAIYDLRLYYMRGTRESQLASVVYMGDGVR